MTLIELRKMIENCLKSATDPHITGRRLRDEVERSKAVVNLAHELRRCMEDLEKECEYIGALRKKDGGHA